MSTSKNNLFQKTSFLAGNNTDYIEEYYSQYLQDPNSLPESWRSFFEGLNEDEKTVSKNPHLYPRYWDRLLYN